MLATAADIRPAGQSQPNVQVLWRRLAALLLDSFVVFLLQGSLTRLLEPIQVRVNHPGALHGSVSLGFATPGLSLAWLLVTTIVYFALFESLLAATPGELLARLRVVDRTGR